MALSFQLGLLRRRAFPEEGSATRKESSPNHGDTWAGSRPRAQGTRGQPPHHRTRRTKPDQRLPQAHMYPHALVQISCVSWFPLRSKPTNLMAVPSVKRKASNLVLSQFTSGTSHGRPPSPRRPWVGRVSGPLGLTPLPLPAPPRSPLENPRFPGRAYLLTYSPLVWVGLCPTPRAPMAWAMVASRWPCG